MIGGPAPGVSSLQFVQIKQLITDNISMPPLSSYGQELPNQLQCNGSIVHHYIAYVSDFTCVCTYAGCGAYIFLHSTDIRYMMARYLPP